MFASLGLAYVVPPTIFGNGGMVLVNKGLPPVFLFLCLLGARRLAREDGFAEWSPLFWFLMASGLYFGFGPLAQYFASEASLAYMDSFFLADDRMVYRTNLLNLWGACATLLGYLTASRWRMLDGVASRLRLRRLDSDTWLWRFALIGLPVKYALALPDRFGILPFVPPTSIVIFETLVSALVFLLTRRIVEGRRRLWPWLAILVIAEFGSAILTFSKLQVLWTVIPLLLGVFSRHRRVWILAAGVAALGMLYVVVLPLVDFGRRAAGMEASTNLRVAAVRNYVGDEQFSVLNDPRGVQEWWTRLDYAPVQSFVMEEFDRGRPGHPFEVLRYAFIPRFLWPSKPVVTQGERLTLLINGTETAKNAPTVFGECYWAGGWIGVFLGGFYVGLIFWLLRRAVAADLSGGSVGLLPLAFFGIMLGLRPDGNFVISYFPSIVIAAVLYVFLRILSRLSGAPRETSRIRRQHFAGTQTLPVTRFVSGQLR